LGNRPRGGRDRLQRRVGRVSASLVRRAVPSLVRAESMPAPSQRPSPSRTAPSFRSSRRGSSHRDGSRCQGGCLRSRGSFHRCFDTIGNALAAAWLALTKFNGDRTGVRLVLMGVNSGLTGVRLAPTGVNGGLTGVAATPKLSRGA
jgi:hypothetical protein